MYSTKRNYALAGRFFDDSLSTSSRLQYWRHKLISSLLAGDETGKRQKCLSFELPKMGAQVPKEASADGGVSGDSQND